MAMLCPRCATTMETYRCATSEAAATIVETVSRCPRCGLRIVVERIEIERNGSEVVVRRIRLPRF